MTHDLDGMSGMEHRGQEPWPDQDVPPPRAPDDPPFEPIRIPSPEPPDPTPVFPDPEPVFPDPADFPDLDPVVEDTPSPEPRDDGD